MGLVVSQFRPMTVDDVVEVAMLEQAEQPRPWSEAVLRDELVQDNRVYLVAGSPIVAFGGFMVVGDEAHITNLLVASSERRRGLGRRLMLALIGAAVAARAEHLTLEVRSSNSAARGLYSGLGLAPVGIRPGYYGDDDALIMWAHDIDQPGFLEALS